MPAADECACGSVYESSFCDADAETTDSVDDVARPDYSTYWFSSVVAVSVGYGKVPCVVSVVRAFVWSVAAESDFVYFEVGGIEPAWPSTVEAVVPRC